MEGARRKIEMKCSAGDRSESMELERPMFGNTDADRERDAEVITEFLWSNLPWTTVKKIFSKLEGRMRVWTEGEDG